MEYLNKPLDYLNITEKEFLDNLDKFTNKTLFERDDETGELIKDGDGNLIRKFFQSHIQRND